MVRSETPEMGGLANTPASLPFTFNEVLIFELTVLVVGLDH